MDEGNIFIRAALHGKFTTPSSSCQPQQESKNKGSQNKYPRQKVANRRYTPVEDTMILQAVEKCGREWRSVAQFMKNHAEVLGETGDFYKDMNVNDKKMHERLRKRANKVLNEQRAQSEGPSKTSSIEEEYQSDILVSGGSSSESEEDPGKVKISNELKHVSQKIQERDDKYVIDPTKQMPERLEEPSSVLRAVKRKREEERREDKKTAKKPKSARKPAKKSASEKLDALLDKLPALLENANKAATAHTKALRSWKRKQGLDESEETDFSNEDE